VIFQIRDLNMLQKFEPDVSVIVKALNEEQHIASAIESALAALAGMNGEVILADGASTDRTVEVAGRYPIKIVRLTDIQDRSCGAGAQLGFQYSRGRYLCLIDGDMRLHKEFLPAAIRFLEANPTAAGVGGIIIERETGNLEFAQRSSRHDRGRQPGPVSCLDCSGVYRRSAIQSVGYLTDRNLHAGEELDLGARLHARGWMLARMGVPAVDHHGHPGSAFALLLERFATRLSLGMGETLRAAIGRSHFWFIVRNDRKLILALLVAAWWPVLLAIPFVLSGVAAAVAAGMIFLLPVAAMSVRWRSIQHGIYCVAAWNAFALSFLPGLLRRRTPPTQWIKSIVVQQGAAATPALANVLSARTRSDGDSSTRP
jgi:glycosyltransferase involved in cell wall biosynthesis